MSEIIDEQGIPMDSPFIDTMKCDLEEALDEGADEGYVFRITVERVLKGARSPVVFTKVE